MNIDEKMRLEEDRHYGKIKELNDILKMYNDNVRENAAYVERNVDQAATFGIDPDRIVSYEESRQYANPYAKQIEDVKADIEKENELHERNMDDLKRQKQEIEQQRMEDELARERERQQREIELISLQQEINKIENERLEIEKRLRTISMETLGSYFSKQIAEKYPEEYQQFQQSKEQVRNHSRNTSQISDLKERFSRVSEDLKLYQGALSVYESYYQRYQEMVKERQQQRASEREQKDIYNLVHSAENERLKNSRSLYTAYDLGNKTIPQEYQGMNYEQVDASIKQKEAEEKARQEVKATRDELLAKAVRKSIGRPEDYQLSQLQVKNLSAQFEGYTNEQLSDYISGVNEIKSEIKEPIQQSYESTSEVEKENLIYDAPIEFTSEHREYKVDPKSLETLKSPEKREELDFSSLLVEDKKKSLVSQIANGMDPSELQYAPLPDVKKRLMEMPMEELENMLATMQPQNEQIQNSGMHR